MSPSGAGRRRLQREGGRGGYGVSGRRRRDWRVQAENIGGQYQGDKSAFGHIGRVACRNDLTNSLSPTAIISS